MVFTIFLRWRSRLVLSGWVKECDRLHRMLGYSATQGRQNESDRSYWQN
ncbi:hypothetical protein [Brunnivagina elsteri]|nr:hypothetical protein [Calothrix elsteri]